MRANAWALSALIAVAVVPAPASARAGDEAIAWDVPCGDRWAFVAAVSELGGSFDGFDVDVRVEPTDAGAFRGRLTIGRAGEVLAERTLEDAECADVIDALAIAAALSLRSLPAPPLDAVPTDAAPTDTVPSEATPHGTPPAPATDDETPPPPIAPLPPAPVATPPRFGLGASFRGGLGPTPGVALAPAIVVALEVERVVVALHVAFWPEASATLADGARGVALWALGATVELGYRIGDEIGVVPALVLEPSVAVARGVGIASPRSEATVVLDGGASATLAWDLDRIRLFVRGDLLFGLVRPAYGVEGERVFASPVVRGTGGAGLVVFF